MSVITYTPLTRLDGLYDILCCFVLRGLAEQQKHQHRQHQHQTLINIHVYASCVCT